MKLFEIYENMNSSDIWSRFEDYLSKETLLQEIDSSNVNELLSESRLLIFKAFGINPEQEGTYFLGGSARLFKNPKLLKVLNQIDRSYPLAIGDLDFVVPGEQEWKNLYKNKYKKIFLNHENQKATTILTEDNKYLLSFKKFEWKKTK